MGGLKALEKINNLIKASAEAQGGDASMVENGLTDDQAQQIERMIIEGIQNIKKKPHIKQANLAKLRAAVYKQKQKDDKPTVRSTLVERPGAPKVNALKAQDTQNHVSENAHSQPKQTPNVHHVHINVNNMAKSQNIPGKQAVLDKIRPPAIPVLRNYNQQVQTAQEGKEEKVKLGVGNAGAGNMP